MPPALSHPAARTHSPRVARALLLGACAIGLSGLAVTAGSHPAAAKPRLVAASTVSNALDLELRAPHAAAVRATVAPHASRSRAAAAKRASRAKKVAHLEGRWVAPNGAAVVSPYGVRWGKLHKGLDFGASYGAPISAAGDGVVIGSGYLSGESGYGMITIVRHDDGFWTAYAHQSRSFVHEGDHVVAGQLIGLVGSTGHSTGPHLHFEVRTEAHGGQIDPRPWLRAHGVDV